MKGDDFIEKKHIIIIILIIILLINAAFLEYKYKSFYDNVQENVKLKAIIISNKEQKEYYNSYIIKGVDSIYKEKKFILYSKSNMDYGDKIKVSRSIL